jgi:hypothetical protein
MKGIMEFLIQLIQRLIIFSISLNFFRSTQIKAKIMKYIKFASYQDNCGSMKSDHVSD